MESFWVLTMVCMTVKVKSVVRRTVVLYVSIIFL